MSKRPVSVLVIESHALMREALCTAIADEPGLAIAAQAASSAEALQIVETLQPNIILFSLSNPGLEDLQAITALRKLLPATPILGLTSNEVRGQEQAALDCGAQAVLTKSAPRSELIRALREMITMET